MLKSGESGIPAHHSRIMNEDRGYPVPKLIWVHRWRCEARLQGMAARGGDICNPGLAIKLLQKVGTDFRISKII
jgi:hypothetical protein